MDVPISCPGLTGHHNFRHDTPVRLTFETNGPRRQTYTRDTTLATVGGCLTVEAICNGKVSGWDSGISVKVSGEITDPTFALAEGELCTCRACVGTVSA